MRSSTGRFTSHLRVLTLFGGSRPPLCDVSTRHARIRVAEGDIARMMSTTPRVSRIKPMSVAIETKALRWYELLKLEVKH